MHDQVLVDTDVASFIFKHDTRAELYRPHIEARLPALSPMTVAELYLWAETHDWGPRRKHQLDQYISRYISLAWTRELCRVWARVMAQTQRDGHSLNAADAWVAAAAIMYELPLITHNGRHFKSVKGLQMICEA